MNHQQAEQRESRQAEAQRGRVDLVSVLFVVCGIPSMIAFFLILFLLTGACDQANIFIPA
jgi:hypothetical protein